MLTPEQLDKIPDSIESLFIQLDEYIVSDFARRVAKAGEVTGTAEWLVFRAREIALADEELQKEVARVMKLTDEQIHELFGDVAFTSADVDRERFESVGLNAERITSTDFLQQYIEAAYKQTMGEFQNLGQSMGFVSPITGKSESLSNFYREQLDLAQLKVSTGVQDYNSAIRQAVKEASAKGVQRIDYESGYHMNLSSAARMVVMTGINQMARHMNDGICDELGLDLVEVTAHAGARPSHQVWQGQIYSRSGNSKEYPDLVDSTGLGDVDGLCGANCRHNYYGYYDGSPRAYTDEQLKHIDPEPFIYNDKEYNIYDATQKMRGMERQMRKTQREIVAYEAVDDDDFDDDLTALSIKLNLQRKEYMKFSRASKLRPRWANTVDAKWNRSEASKSAWRVRKANQ